MNLVTIELIDLMLQFVHYPFIKNISLLVLVHYVCHCNFTLFVNFMFTFAEKNSFAVSFSQV